jgi:hypothetical protein
MLSGTEYISRGDVGLLSYLQLTLNYRNLRISKMLFFSKGKKGLNEREPLNIGLITATTCISTKTPGLNIPEEHNRRLPLSEPTLRYAQRDEIFLLKIAKKNYFP